MADLGSPLPLRAGLRVFFLGQLGKYLPGSIWPTVTQMELGRDYRVPQRVSVAAAAIAMLLAVGTGLLVATVLLPLGAGVPDPYRWAAAVLPVAVLLLAAPPVQNRLLGVALRVARRAPLPAPLSLAGAGRAAAWALAAWLLYGIHVWLLARQLEAAGGLALLLVSTGPLPAPGRSGSCWSPPRQGPGCAKARSSCCCAPRSAGPRPPWSGSSPGCCSWPPTSP